MSKASSKVCSGCNKRFSVIDLTKHWQQSQNSNCHAIWEAMEEEMMPGIRKEISAPFQAQNASSSRIHHSRDFFGEFNPEQIIAEDTMMIDEDDDEQIDIDAEIINTSDAENLQDDNLPPLGSMDSDYDEDSDDELDDGFEYVYILSL